MKTPDTVPENDAPGLWAVQNQLLQMAEELVGLRDKNKELCQPSFHQNGPHLRHTPDLDGAFAELSCNSKQNWENVIYELSHETVHLLNPVIGATTWLEEGVAVEFSIYAQQQYGLVAQEPTSGSYLDALNLVRALPGKVFANAKTIREAFGSLGAISADDLQDLFPSTGAMLLEKLASECVPR